MKKEKVEIHTFELIDKMGKFPLKFEKEITKQLLDIFGKRFIQHIDLFPPQQLDNKTVKIDNEKGKSLWKVSSSTNRITGILIVGKDSDKVLKFTKVDRLKTSGGKKEKGINIDKPYFFQLIFPENKKTGFIFLQKHGIEGCKNVFVKLMQTLLNKEYGTLKLTTQKFIEQELFRNYLSKGNYNEIIFTRKGIPTDILDNYVGDYENRGSYNLETKISANSDTDFSQKFKGQIIKLLDEEESFFEISELPKHGFDKDSSFVKINSTFGGKARTIDLSNSMKIQPVYELDDVELNDDGFCDFESITDKVTKLIKEINIDIL